MRAFLKLALVISRDSAQRICVFNNAQSPNILDDEMPGPANGDGRSIVLAAGGPSSAYQEIDFGGVTPEWLYIECDQPITVRLNSVDGLSGTEIPVTPIQALIPINTPSQATVPPQNGTLFLHGTLATGLNLWVKNLAGSQALLTVAYAGN